MARDDTFNAIDGGILAAQGFRAAGAACGIKLEKGKRDIALLVADDLAPFGATLTRNRVKAAPVIRCQRLLRRVNAARCVVVNSGNANACTGKQGERDADEMARIAASAIGCDPTEVLVASTGVIGRPLPMGKVREGIQKAAKNLSGSPAAARRFASAIMTTDTVIKEAAVQVELNDGMFRIGGCAKGAGMIAPNMGTMLAFLTTDADVDPAVLRKALKTAVQASFNCITVDGHTSTNDTAVLLASRASSVTINTKSRIALFEHALAHVALELAKAIVRDGEGATKIVRIDVTGALKHSDARTIAQAISRSPLNLTAIHGGDPNWGRFISSAGYAGPKMLPSKARLFINGWPAYVNGAPADTPGETLAREMQRSSIYLHLDLGLGRGKATVWTCDLSREYVTINADYHT